MNDKILCPICSNKESYLIISTNVHMQNDTNIYLFHKCSNCKIVYLKNPPSSKNLNLYYNQEYLPYSNENMWGKYSNLVSIWQKYLDKKRALFVKHEFKDLLPQTQALDFGCGNPSFLKLLKMKTGIHCAGYDFSENGWKNQKEKYLDIDLFTGEFNEIKFKQKFDIITLWHSLEHHFEPKKLISQLYKISSDNAILIIEVPNYDSITRFIQKKYWAGYHTPRHSVIYTPETINYLMHQEGWKIQKVYKYGTFDSYTFWWLGKLEKIRERKKINSNNLEKLFLHFLLFKILYFPIFLFERFFSFGIMLIVCRK